MANHALRPNHNDARTSARAHALYILPELAPSRLERLRILILADGNTRGSSSGGYAGGARRVVSIAEHLARRPDVAVMVACILSPDNIAKRGDGFFFKLYREFIQLGVDIEAEGALVSSQVRLSVQGDLAPLRARGGHAVVLADAIEAVSRATDVVRTPALHLLLGVGYGPETARELDVDIVLRTGMEEPGVLRLSGLETGERIASCALTTLWPDVAPAEVDAVIDLCKQRVSRRFVGGYDVAALTRLVEALAKAESGAPMTATIAARAPAAEVATALEHLYEGALRSCPTVAVEIGGQEVPTPKRYGPDEAPYVLRIVGGELRGRPPGEGELLSVLAPGQQAPLFTLPDWLPLGHANIHACEASAPGLVEGILAAARFAEAHPPLLGRDRGSERRSGEMARVVLEERRGASERDEIGDGFAEKTLAWAAELGLLLPGEAWRRAAVNYALTAFFIHFRIPTEWDEDGAGWEARADLTARYMILVAAGDEAIFDAVLPGETPEQRRARLGVSARFLQGALRRDGGRDRAPEVHGAELLETIAEAWRRLVAPYRRACLPAAEASFREGLERLYAASVAEYRVGVGEERRAGQSVKPRFAEAPPCVAARAEALGDSAARGMPGAARELRALGYLAEVGSAIGAGLLFRTAALAAPAACVSGRSIVALDAATTLLDYHVRLSNDLSGFLESTEGDRDPKENACTILVPGWVSGAERATAIVKALATCQRLAGWLAGEVGGNMARVAAAWPSMGVILQRGVFVGRRVYEVGHYTTVERAGMSAIFDAWEELGRAGDEGGVATRETA